MGFVGKLVVLDGVRVHEDYGTDLPVESIGLGMTRDEIEAQRRRKGYGEYSNRYMPLRPLRDGYDTSTADRAQE